MTDGLSELDRELRDVARRVERRIDPGATAMVVAVAVLVLIGAFLLPWIGDERGWDLLVGEGGFGILPRIFTFAALIFGVAASGLALALRHWWLAWVCAAGCGISTITGVWAVWSRQISVPQGGLGPEFGLVLALVTIVVLAATWARIALRR
ncbi:hypothetical protein [Pseudonocardia sp. N23]|uniref:Rv2732c family membrane protein n=1 Tax=Pseudonocardia sp. N23 TaxID=1987376 RepID=UPI0011459F90|nr:hypothetical protein [Pseudonocardia sp. N23]